MTCRATGISRIAGAFALAGALSLVAIMPACAASPNEAFVASSTGPITTSPTGLATLPGSSPTTVANASIAGLLSAGAGTDTVDATDASSTLADVGVTLSAIAALTADAAGSSCTFDTDTATVSGTTTLTNAAFTMRDFPTALAASPAPNTTVSIPGMATLTLNAQATAGDGTLTVTALQVSLLGSNQTLSLGVSVCNSADLSPVPVLPGKTMTVTLGAAGLLGLAGAGQRLRRRSQARITRGIAAAAR